MITAIEFKNFIDLTGTSYDERIAQIIAGVNRFVENYCSNKLEAGSVTEYFDGDEVCDYDLFLSNRINVSALTLSYNTGTQSTPVWTALTTDDYVEYLDEGRLKLNNVFAGEKNYKVVYTAGYAVASAPADLKLACLKIASAFFNKGKSEGHASEGLDGASVSFQNSLTPEIKQLLGKYCSKNL